MRRLDISEILSADKGFDKVPKIRRVFEELKGEEGFRTFSEKLISLNYRLKYKLPEG